MEKYFGYLVIIPLKYGFKYIIGLVAFKIETEINSIIYKLYKLTTDEITLVESLGVGGTG